jgi:hypothetical protein
MNALRGKRKYTDNQESRNEEPRNEVGRNGGWDVEVGGACACM